MRFFAIFAIFVALWAEPAADALLEAPEINTPDPEPPDLSSLKISPTKMLYFKTDADFSRNFYVGQSVSVRYEMLLLGDFALREISLLDPETTSGARLTNATPWQEKQNDDATGRIFEAVLTFKILKTDAFLPRIHGVAANLEEKDEFSTPKIPLRALNLHTNTRFCGVVGNFAVIQSVTKTYDDEHNIMIMELSAQNANLEDFRVPIDAPHQGFQSLYDVAPVLPEYNAPVSENALQNDENPEILTLDPKTPPQIIVSQQKIPGEQRGTYYVIFKKNKNELNFDYFAQNSYKNVKIPVILRADTVGTQDDLRPKNVFLLYSSIILIVAMIIFSALFLFTQKKIFAIFAGILLLFLLYRAFYRPEISLPRQTIVRILPTENSTILTTTSDPERVEIIGTHEKYYKIQLKTGQIGWVKKGDE